MRALTPHTLQTDTVQIPVNAYMSCSCCREGQLMPSLRRTFPVAQRVQCVCDHGTHLQCIEDTVTAAGAGPLARGATCSGQGASSSTGRVRARGHTRYAVTVLVAAMLTSSRAAGSLPPKPASTARPGTRAAPTRRLCLEVIGCEAHASTVGSLTAGWTVHDSSWHCPNFGCCTMRVRGHCPPSCVVQPSCKPSGADPQDQTHLQLAAHASSGSLQAQ